MKWIFSLKMIMMIALFFAEPCSAIDELHPFYRGIRAKGMGGVQVPTVNDETALIVNPAALGKLRDFYGTVLDPEIDFSANYLTLVQSSSLTDTLDLEKVKNSLVTNTDTYYHYHNQIFPSFVARNFGIGILQNKSMDAYMDTAAANMDTFYRDDLSLLLGYSLRFFDGFVKIGVVGKVISRIEMNKILSVANSSFSVSTLAGQGHVKEGLGTGYDVGLMLTAPWATLPTLTAVVRDVGSTSFTSKTGVRLTSTDTPAQVSQDMDVGISFTPIVGKNNRLTLGVEYTNLLTASAIDDKAKLLHAGMEYNISDVVFFRAGYNQRYWTAGFELASEHYQFQFATYGEETGTLALPYEDRRYTFKIAWRY